MPLWKARLGLVAAALCVGIFAVSPVSADGAAQAVVDAEARSMGRLIRVGPDRALKTISAAAREAQDGDTIEIDAGDYRGDVAVWTHDRLTVRGVGGRVRLTAAGRSAEQKAIWVVRGGSMVVENIEFRGARVPHRNGAGIRFESGHLLVRNCLFEDNETGILTAWNKSSELEIEASEFGYNGAADGFSHNLYVGAIRKLTVTGSYFHHAKIGHLLKSRALENHIRYNRLTDEVGGRASYELEFPNGGVAYVVGNIIEQSSQTENPTIVSFGAEGYLRRPNELYLVNNTLVDSRPGRGVFLRVKSGADRIFAKNNLLIGGGNLESAGAGEYAGNLHAEGMDVALAAGGDYRLRKRSRLVGRAEDLGVADGQNLRPRREYLHPMRTRTLPPGPYSPGAHQALSE